MAIDPEKSKALGQVVQQHPAMCAVAVSPGVLAIALVWWLAGPFLAIVAGIVVIGGGLLLLTRTT
ncbi:MAG: hypothetical protein QM662_02215 [Gordonia sp. (in: high G+C Gram-positive bacteria)]